MINFFVDGTPYAKQSFRYARKAGYGYQKKSVIDWQSAIAQTARISYNGDPIQSELYVKLTFYVKVDRADLDNLTKAVLDAMQGIIYENDKQIMRLFITKIPKSDRTGVDIKIAELK